MTKIARDSKTGRFVIGRHAFGKVSSVEGIKPSRSLSAKLKELENASDQERRNAISHKWMKRDTQTGKLLTVKQDGKLPKGVRREK